MSAKFQLIDTIVNDATPRDLARCGIVGHENDMLCNAGCGNEGSCHDACCGPGIAIDTGGSFAGIGGDSYQQAHPYWPYRCSW